MLVVRDDTTIYYETHGVGPPTLLMIHGGLVDTRSWSNQLELANEFKLILPDTRNFGRSSGPTAELSIDDLVDDALLVLDELGETDVFVLGFSIGGVIAQALAARRPSMVRGLILASTLPSGSSLPPAQTGVAEVELHVNRAFSEAFRLSHSGLIASYTEMAAENVSKEWNAFRATVATGPPSKKVRAEFPRPILVVHARSDEAIAFEQGEGLHDRLPGSQFEIVEDSGHTIQVERPSLFNDLVRRFVLANASAK